jgi:archaellum component FlaC
MSWAEALKEYAKGTGKFVVPKKGTPEYEAVAKIHRKLKGVPEPAPEKPSRRTKKVAVAPEEDAPIPPNSVAEKKKVLAKLHEQGIAEKKAAKEESRASNRKAVVEEKKALADKEDRYAKIEAELAEIKKHFSGKKDMDANPAHVERIEKIKKTREEKRAVADAKKVVGKKVIPFKVEAKPVTLTFSD